MTQATQTDFNATYHGIVQLLEQEEDIVASFVDIAKREARRQHIGNEIQSLSKRVTDLRNRYNQLPSLPPLDVVQWAQAALEMPNLSIVVLETTGVDDHADILRILITDREGNALFDPIIHPQRFFTTNSQYTGLTVDQIADAAPLDEYWTHLKAVLAGRYVLAFNLSFVEMRLEENAKFYGLPPITLIGEDLQEKCRRYWSGYYPPKLTALCGKIAYPLPTPAIAPDRAKAQLALLQAMAAGVTEVKREEATDDLSDIDEGPF